MKDNVFSSPIEKQFEFDEKVATVFDDMVTRSVPFYKESLYLFIDTLLPFLQPSSTILDLGCSTATTLIELGRKSPFPLHLIGIDNAKAMIDKAQQKSYAFNIPIEFILDDITQCPLPQANAIIINYVLQFIRPLQRENFLQRVYDALLPEGIVIIGEKILSSHSKLSKVMIDNYHYYKKTQGYSDMEIMQKREALENVLIPYTLEENIALLKKVGFTTVEILFKYNSFSTFIAIKG